MFICAIGLYSLVVVLVSISGVHENARLFFDYGPDLYPILITAATAISPFAFFMIAVLVWLNKRSYAVIPLAIYGYIFFISVSVYGMFAALLYWWFGCDKAKSG